MSGDLWFVTLNMGGGRYAPRSEVTEQALVVTRALLDLTQGQQVDHLGRVQAEHFGGGVMIRISDAQGARAVIGVAPRARIGAAIWRALHAEGIAALSTDPATPPPAPWCGLVLADRMRERPHEETRELVVLARVMGWAWLERD